MELFRIEKSLLNIVCLVCIMFIVNELLLRMLLSESEKAALDYEFIEMTPDIMICQAIAFTAAVLIAITIDIVVRAIFRSKDK